jgi:hypothetical protein
MVKFFEVEADDFKRIDPASDSYTKQELGDTRKPKLTLRALNKLKKIRAAKRLEQLERFGTLEIMYGTSSAEETPGI